MKSENRFFLTANAVFFWLWLLSILFSFWMAFGFVAFFLPFNTEWISVVRNFSWLYLGLGCLIHLLTLISHQQVLFERDFPSQLPTNLTLSLFLHKALWLFLWNGPYYALIAIMIAQRLSIMSLIQKESGQPVKLFVILILLWLLLCSVLLQSVHWIGISLIYRHSGKTNLLYLGTVWLRSIKAFFSSLPVWFITYSLIAGLVTGMGVFLWSYWTIGRFLYSASFRNYIYPEGWLLSFTLACVGLESFLLPFFSLASSETNRSIQDS